MKKIIFKYDSIKIDEAIERLNIKDIFNIFYDSPFEVINTDYGYEYEETEGEGIIDVNIIVEDDLDLNRVRDIIISEFGFKDSEIEVVDIESDFDYKFDPIDLGNGWILCDPSYETKLNRIDFVPQGAFGTGEHETTQDCLRWILENNLSGKSVIDIGTGSGILSIAASIRKARSITAVDIRDVREEVEFNASLNNINNINIVIGNIIEDRDPISSNYDITIINIGGEETLMFMDTIKDITKQGGNLLVSGLFIKCFEKVIDSIESYGFILIKRIKNGEWCTAIFEKTIH